jgi:hypothetical protein
MHFQAPGKGWKKVDWRGRRRRKKLSVFVAVVEKF